MNTYTTSAENVDDDRPQEMKDREKQEFDEFAEDPIKYEVNKLMDQLEKLKGIVDHRIERTYIENDNTRTIEFSISYRKITSD